MKKDKSLKDEFIKRAYIYMGNNTDLALRYLPRKLITPDMCLKAVKNGGDNFQYVPKELRTPELSFIAEEYLAKTFPDPDYESFLQDIPEDISEDNVSEDNLLNRNILQTPELCLMAVQSSFSIIKHVPKKLRTMDICLAAIKTYCDKTNAACWKPIGRDRASDPKLCIFRYIPEKVMIMTISILIKCANKWKESYVNANIDDLINEGFSGLMDAAVRFDASYQMKFISYGVKCIQWYMGKLARKSEDVKKEDFDSAIAYYTKSIRVGKRSEESYESYRGRGKIYLEHKKNYDAAISDFKKSIKICGGTKECKGCAECYNLIGKAYFAKGNDKLAIKNFIKANQLKPGAPYDVMECGIECSNGAYDRAIAFFSAAIEMGEHSCLSTAYYNRGSLYCQNREYDKAIADWEATLQINPDNADAMTYNNLGWCYAQLQQYDKALEYCKKSIKLAPDNVSAYHSIGFAYLGKKKYDNAIKYFTKAIELRGNRALCYLDRGRAYAGKKDYDSAIADFETALRIEPDNELAKKELHSLL